MSNPENTIALLKKVPLFNGLSERQLKMLSGSFVTRNFADGEEMVKQGEGGVGIFVIVSGKAEAIREKANGDKISVNTFGTADFFGELALLNEGPRTATVIARSNLECLVLPRWDFISLLKEDADMAVSVAQELASHFRSTLDSMF